MKSFAAAVLIGVAIASSPAVVAQTPEQINAALERKGSKTFEANKLLAEQGNADAQLLIAIAYFSGDGVKVDMQQSTNWMRKAAGNGQAKAQILLGEFLLDGLFLPKDVQQAVEWFRKAAERGDDEAQLKLGDLFSAGTAVTKNDQSAYFWWLLSSAQGNKEAKKKRDKVEKKLTSQQLADAQTQAKTWKVK